MAANGTPVTQFGLLPLTEWAVFFSPGKAKRKMRPQLCYNTFNTMSGTSTRTPLDDQLRKNGPPGRLVVSRFDQYKVESKAGPSKYLSKPDQNPRPIQSQRRLLRTPKKRPSNDVLWDAAYANDASPTGSEEFRSRPANYLLGTFSRRSQDLLLSLKLGSFSFRFLGSRLEAFWSNAFHIASQHLLLRKSLPEAFQ
ncbi:unnamed protein product [Caenorhabditis auriculariae]|uniref:Uncharacterized protein n=1 Tax=Caenorhabditis auriculariae TaxID=2777116 RepID=A0A8S1H8T0_9PELO|nr:unnamed protein product [Caenorhabditis auriculariae]